MGINRNAVISAARSLGKEIRSDPLWEALRKDFPFFSLMGALAVVVEQLRHAVHVATSSAAQACAAPSMGSQLFSDGTPIATILAVFMGICVLSCGLLAAPLESRVCKAAEKILEHLFERLKELTSLAISFLLGANVLAAFYWRYSSADQGAKVFVVLCSICLVMLLLLYALARWLPILLDLERTRKVKTIGIIASIMFTALSLWVAIFRVP